DDFGLKRSWEELTNILSKNEDEAIKYLMNCSEDDVLLIQSSDYSNRTFQTQTFLTGNSVFFGTVLRFD
ncbi:hypothetical protein WP50_33940, partial [Lactiplantibacillus plantarum]